tara:strand:- start:7260 stop:8684 length:1425 start_codon:yes stop_codon:yes gene_type:complete
MMDSLPTFQDRAKKALHDKDLQNAMNRAKGGFVGKRKEAVSQLPEFETLRDAARDIKDHTLSHLDKYLEMYENRVLENGGHVHWARNAEEASTLIVELCRDAGANLVTKGKSMVSEEIELNAALERAGIEPVETDLGEYIVQLAAEKPSHIIAPAVHKTRDQITELFHTYHQPLGYFERVYERKAIVNEARSVLRDRFFSADVGITGANFLVAETGSSVIVTNEGNGDLTSCLPRVQIVIAGIEKVIPSLEDLSTMLRILARSATGQEMTAYTSLYSGPQFNGQFGDGREYHVVLLDNGRSGMLGGEYKAMLRCIRCGACLNHCPVYTAIGGHAYGWVYPGPMGSVLTPLMQGFDTNFDLPNACSLNGACQDVCPVRIPLPDLLRKHRAEQFRRQSITLSSKIFFAVWQYLVLRPRFYQIMIAPPLWLFSRLGKKSGFIKQLPLMGGWTKTRDFPAPASRSFQKQWQDKIRQKK